MFSLYLCFKTDIINTINLLQKGEISHGSPDDWTNNTENILAFYVFFLEDRQKEIAKLFCEIALFLTKTPVFIGERDNPFLSNWVHPRNAKMFLENL